jgi:hypothetical protein
MFNTVEWTAIGFFGGMVAGGWWTIYIAATGLADRAKKRGMKAEMNSLLMPEAAYQQKQNEVLAQTYRRIDNLRGAK